MAEFYIGQVMMTGFGFAQKYFAQCNAQTLSVAQNQALFALLGTVYGGNGVTTFQLPDLRSRTPVGAMRNYPMGTTAGVENVTLTLGEMPAHNHLVDITTQNGTTFDPTGGLYATALDSNNAPLPAYVASSSINLVPLNSLQISQVGGNQPHPNVQPYTTINFNIALSGVWPSRN
jgi:microcystin-dependent protein